MKHVNAAEVLPQELLLQVQQYCSGYIYVPSPPDFYRGRRDEILNLRAQGLSTTEIARRVHVCVRRVQQIIRHSSPEKACK